MGDACMKQLRKYGVSTGDILYGDEHIVIYFLETGAVVYANKVIYDRVYSSFSGIEP